MTPQELSEMEHKINAALAGKRVPLPCTVREIGGALYVSVGAECVLPLIEIADRLGYSHVRADSIRGVTTSEWRE